VDGLGVAASDSGWERLSAVAREVTRFSATVTDFGWSGAVIALEGIVAQLRLTIGRSESSLLVEFGFAALTTAATVLGVTHAAASVALDVALALVRKVALFETSLANSFPGAIIGDVPPPTAAFAGQCLAIACLMSQLLAQLTGGMQGGILSALNPMTCRRQTKVLPASGIGTMIPCRSARVGVEVRFHLLFDNQAQALNEGVDVFQGKLRHFVVVRHVVSVGELLAFRSVLCILLQPRIYCCRSVVF
jgi:hypothetical protein